MCSVLSVYGYLPRYIVAGSSCLYRSDISRKQSGPSTVAQLHELSRSVCASLFPADFHLSTANVYFHNLVLCPRPALVAARTAEL